jgi:hypothetical protein
MHTIGKKGSSDACYSLQRSRLFSQIVNLLKKLLHPASRHTNAVHHANRVRNSARVLLFKSIYGALYANDDRFLFFWSVCGRRMVRLPSLIYDLRMPFGAPYVYATAVYFTFNVVHFYARARALLWIVCGAAYTPSSHYMQESHVICLINRSSVTDWGDHNFQENNPCDAIDNLILLSRRIECDCVISR